MMEWTIRWWQVSIKRVYPTSAKLSQTNNRSASWWHQHIHFFRYDQAYIELWRALQNDGVLSRLKDNSRLCDCGIGTAAFSLAFIKASHLNAYITGVDISSQMLNKAHQRLSQANVNHQMCQSEVNTLPFVDNSFDIVTSAHMLEHLPNPTQGLQEMIRILRPGAPLILTVGVSRWTSIACVGFKP